MKLKICVYTTRFMSLSWEDLQGLNVFDNNEDVSKACFNRPFHPHTWVIDVVYNTTARHIWRQNSCACRCLISIKCGLVDSFLVFYPILFWCFTSIGTCVCVCVCESVCVCLGVQFLGRKYIFESVCGQIFLGPFIGRILLGPAINWIFVQTWNIVVG